MELENTATAQRLIYGCMGFGGSWDDPSYDAADIDQARAAVAAARAAGIVLFDHADIYRGGKAESVFGELLAETPGLRQEILLQSKCGIHRAGGGFPVHYDLSRENILGHVNDSLTRLRTDHLDTLLLHRPDPLMDVREVADAVAELMADGKIRSLGVSNMSGAQMAYLQDNLQTPLVANQLQLSLAHRGWVESTVLVNRNDDDGADGFPHGTLEYAASNGVELQAYGSLAKGRYTGQPIEGPGADADTAALMLQLAATHNTTPEAVLLGWLMKHPARISPVIGTTNPARIAACADAPRIAAAMTRMQWYEIWTAARGHSLP